MLVCGRDSRGTMVGSCKAHGHEGGKDGERKWCNERKPVCMFHQETQKLIMSKAMLTNTLKFPWKEMCLSYCTFKHEQLYIQYIHSIIHHNVKLKVCASSTCVWRWEERPGEWWQTWGFPQWRLPSLQCCPPVFQALCHWNSG